MLSKFLLQSIYEGKTVNKVNKFIASFLYLHFAWLMTLGAIVFRDLINTSAESVMQFLSVKLRLLTYLITEIPNKV